MEQILTSMDNEKMAEIKAKVEQDVDLEKDDLSAKAKEIMHSYIWGPAGFNEHYNIEDIFYGIIKLVEKEKLDAEVIE